MFAFYKVIIAVIILAVIVWFLTQGLFSFVGGIAKRRAEKMKRNFTAPDNKEDDVENE